jgi:hypothetical protein
MVGTKRKKQQSGTRAMSIDRHSVDTSTQRPASSRRTIRLRANRPSPKMTGVTMTNQKYDAIIIGTSDERQPLGKRLSEAGVGTDYDEAQRVGSSAA